MELLKLFLLGLCYFLITLFSGRLLLSVWKINFKNEILNFSIGFILVEFISFLFFICSGALGFKSFLISFLPNIILLILLITWKIRYPENSIFHFTTEAGKILWVPSFVVFSVLAVLYFLSAYSQFFAVINLSGVIYQDLIYHAGIVHSIINFGFPVPDPQYYGKILNYHYFTHFLTAKISYISFSNPVISYHLFLNFLGTLFYSFLSISFIKNLTGPAGKENKIKIRAILISLGVFFCTFWMGGVMNYSFVGGFYFSESFQWQLFLMIAYFMVVRYVIASKDYSGKNMLILLLLLCTATVTKVSSLPLLFSGIFSLILYNAFYKGTGNSKYWGILSLLNLICGILIFLIFFSGANSESAMLEFNLDLVKITPVVAFLGIENPVVLLLIYTVTVLSFRFILFAKLKNYEVWFSGAVLLTGFVLSLLFKENQLYFILPAILLASFFSFIYIFSLKNKKILLLPALAFLIFSFYPIGGLGSFIPNKLSEKADYFPLNNERVALYQWINENTPEDEVIFTTSLLASPDDMPDNYSPAAFSGRIFYLGGYRFGGVENTAGFKHRLNLVKNFEIDNEKILRELKKEGIQYILIERKGNFNNELFSHANMLEGGSFYEVVFRNSEGIILEVNK